MDAAKLRRHERQVEAEKHLLEEESESRVFKEAEEKEKEVDVIAEPATVERNVEEVDEQVSQPQPKVTKNVKQLDIILLDGTWSQARKMVKRVFRDRDLHTKMIPVKISPQGLSQFCLRRQTQEDRISTVEAAGCLLEVLNVFEGPESKAEKEICSARFTREYLNEALHVLCD